MLFNTPNFTMSMLSNPTLLASAVIQAMEDSDTTGGTQINDPNNGFTMMLFSNFCVFSKFSEKVDYTNSYFYPQRARNSAQLYPHLSEFDYVQLMASPATLPFVFAMSEAWIVANAVPYDSNYNKIEIPATSYFTMGGIIYSMYYPIQILVNINTGAISATYDISVTNPLNTLESNMLLNVQRYTKDGIGWFQITFNMYQFQCSTTSYKIGTTQGFNKIIDVPDQFYAARVFFQNSDLTYTEFTYCLSQMYYDYTTPTAILNLLTSQNQIQIQIPQIYFDSGQVSQSIQIQLYTTKGAVNYSVSLADWKSLTANFQTSSSSYAAPLAQMPSWNIVPTTTIVAGGSNPMTYEEIRTALVNQGLYDRVAVTPNELIVAAQKAGFDNIYKVQDDLTERMYFATSTMLDGNSVIIPCFSGSVLLEGDSLEGNPSSILNFSDEYLTMLPTTVFTIPSSGTTCTPLSNGQVQALNALSAADLVSELNNGTYVRQPFHITLYTSPTSPQASVYNLMSPAMSDLTFVAENAHSSPQMSVTACALIHQANGTGGYLINMTVTRSTNILGVAASNFQVILTCKNKLGYQVYIPATYVTVDANSNDIWQIVLPTTYHLTTDNYLRVMMYNTSDQLVETDININQSFTVLTSFTATYAPTIPQDSTLNPLLPPSMQVKYTVMAQQAMTLVLGTNLTTSIYAGVTTTWGDDVYETAPVNIYYTTNVPIFQVTETGIINTQLGTNNAIEVVEIYPIGATPSSKLDINLVTSSVTSIPTSGTTTTFAVVDTTGLINGMGIRGTSLPANSTVQSFTSNSVTISSLITAPIPIGSTLIATNPSMLVRTTATQSAAGKVLTVASTAGMLPGLSVFGFNMATGETIASVNSPTQITLTIGSVASVADNTLLTIINTRAYGVVKTAAGSVVTDGNGNAVVMTGAANQYNIPTILFDGRLFASQDPADITTVSNLYSDLQNYANQIENIDQGLLESSQVFFKPLRTMGNATFGVGNSVNQALPLSLSLTVTVYVPLTTYNNTQLTTTMTSSIYSTINTQIASPLISIQAIGEAIKTILGINADDVEVGGINNNPTLQLIAIQESDVTAGIDYILVLNGDGTISRQPNIVVNYVVTPSTEDLSPSTATTTTITTAIT